MTVQLKVKGYINGQEWGARETAMPDIDSKVIIETDINKIQDFCEGFGVNFIYVITITSIICADGETDVQDIVNYNIGYNEEGGAIDSSGSKIDTGRVGNVIFPLEVYGEITDPSYDGTEALHCYTISEVDGIIENEFEFNDSNFSGIIEWIPDGHSMIIFTPETLL